MNTLPVVSDCNASANATQGSNAAAAQSRGSDGPEGRHPSRRNSPSKFPATSAACSSGGLRRETVKRKNLRAAPQGNLNQTYSRCPPSNPLKFHCQTHYKGLKRVESSR